MTNLKNYFSFLLLYYIFSLINGILSEINTDQTSSPLNLSDELIDSTFNIIPNQDSVLNSSSTKPGVILESLTDTDQNSNVYSISGNEVLENETTPNVIVIHNNVSTNKSQQTKPNLTIENNYSELNIEKNPVIHIEDSNISTDSKNLDLINSDSNISEDLVNKTSTNLILPATINSQSETNTSALKQPQLINSFDDLIEYKLNETKPIQNINDEKIESVTSDLIQAYDKNSNFSSKNINEKTINTNSSDINETKDFPKTIVNHPEITPELYAPFASLPTSLIQSNSQKGKNNIEKNIINPLNSDQEIASKNNFTLSSSPNLLEHLYSTNSENRLRWINNHYTRNRLPPYPPKQPHLPGIPSGFRNPISTVNTLPPSNNNNIPSGMINGVSTPPLNIGNNSPFLNTALGTKTGSINTNSLNLASIVNSLSNSNNYGNSVPNIASFPYPPASSHSNLISSASILTPNNYPNNNAFINPSLSPEVEAEIEAGLATATHSFSRRPGINITRVEHIAAECSDDYMKVIINFNGTFTGLVYSSGYVHDANCIYVNGTGRNGYEFYIRLNQCGTMGREEMHHPKRPGEVRRRDQVMWNTLSIQYNGMIEEEWDEHYRVTCEYGSDYWKTVTFPSFNVEVNTGSPVVFTINPPQCQMEVRRGFGIAGSRTSGPVTVGDPLTLLIHMKSEKAGFDILVKNCISHNGANQRLQLIDTNGCVTNEKLISPFRGTYNSDDGHQVTLYAYLKAFRFTGSPALYLECDIHMCHNKCPPQRCYWRNLSKRSTRSILNESYYDDQVYGEPIPMGKYNFTLSQEQNKSNNSELISESLSLFQALEVRHSDDNEEDYEKRKILKKYKNSDLLSSEYRRSSRKEDFLKYIDELDEDFLNEELIQNKFCFTGFNLLFITISTIIVLMSAVSTSILSCIKLRKLKTDFYRYDNERDRMSAISKSTSSKTMFYGQPHFSRRY